MNKQPKMTRLFAPLSIVLVSSSFAHQAMAQTAADYAATVVLPDEVIVHNFEDAETGVVDWAAGGDDAQITCNVNETANDYALEVSYNSLGDWGGTEVQIPEADQDWTAYSEITFQFKGAGDGSDVNLEIRDGSATSDSGSAEGWSATITDDAGADWRTVTIPFASFSENGWQPCTDSDPTTCNGTLDLTHMHSIVFGPPNGTQSGVFYVNDVQISDGAGTDLVVGSFDYPESAASFQNDGEGIPPHSLSVCGAANVPGNAGSTQVLEVEYVEQVGWGGIAIDYETAKDWTGIESLGFLFKGTNSGSTYIVELREGGANAGASEQWRASFVDNSVAWQLVSFSFDEFERRSDWQPCTADAAVCDEVFDVTAVMGIAINSPLDVAGSYSLDQLTLNSDTDGDGILDGADECPGTPLDEEGFDETRGCTPSQTDGDGDGIFGALDLCPDTTPEELEVGVDVTGCALFDDDNDGVFDNFGMDVCLGSVIPEGTEDPTEYVNASGCYLDSDADGVYNSFDLCPETPIENPASDRVDSDGCYTTSTDKATVVESASVGSLKGASSSFDLLALLGLFGLGVVGLRRRK